MEHVRFYFDPRCPWCYQTSRMARRLEELGEVSVDWAFFCLEVANRPEGQDPFSVEAPLSGPALRTAALLRQRAGRASVGAFYHALGLRAWETETPIEVNDLDGLRLSLKDIGADPSLVDEAVSDPQTWTTVVEEHLALVARTGAFGVPTIVLDGGDGPAIFGPVVYKRPADEDVVELWRHISWLVRHDNFAELKRSGGGLPDLPAIEYRARRHAAAKQAEQETPVPNVQAQTPAEPDTFEKLRAQRGEGWQWHRIQHDPCPQCGDHPGSVPPAELGALALERAGRWREFLEQTDETVLRHIPEPGVFSPLQYAAHVRDIIRVYTDRMILGLEQDVPTVPMFNPPKEVWEAYNHADVTQIADDLQAQAQRLADVLAGMSPSAWSRIVVNDRGTYGVYTFTMPGLACNIVHEQHHHLLDATGSLGR